MADTQVPLMKGDRVDPNTDYRDALPVNMFAIERKILGGNGYMLCYPGLALHGTGSGIDRAANYNERFFDQYRVSGQKLISVDEAGTVVELGDVPGTEQASMPYSFNTQAVIANGQMWLYSPSGGFVEVTDPDLGDPIDGVWVDGYYFMTDGEYLFHTDIDDESSIDPLKFATSEYSPDKTLGVSLTQDNKVMAWNRFSLEYFVNAATENFAFQRVPSRAQKIGIVATHAKCEAASGWYITGGMKNQGVGIHLVGVGRAEKVSTREIDKLLGAYTEAELSDMRMECRKDDNVTFILVHLPNETLCFNETIAQTMGKESAWSILKSGVEFETQTPYRAINGVFDGRLSKWIYGDTINTNIGELDNTVFTQYEARQEWELYTPLVKGDSISIDEIELETLPGNSPDNDATVFTSLTYDGLTYGQEWFQLYGENQRYGQRFILRRLGYVADWVGFKFRGATKSRMAFAIFKVKYG